MTAKIIKFLPFYMAEWENGTKIFFPTRDIKPYLPAHLSPERSRAYAEELKSAADLLDYWISASEQDKIVTLRQSTREKKMGVTGHYVRKV